MTTTDPALQPVAPARPRRGWYLASGITVLLGGVLTVVIAIVVAVLKISANPIVGAQAGWNVWGGMVYAFQVAVTGWGGVFALAALVFAVVGLVKHGRSPLGVVLVVISALLALQLLAIPAALHSYDVYIY